MWYNYLGRPIEVWLYKGVMPYTNEKIGSAFAHEVYKNPDYVIKKY